MPSQSSPPKSPLASQRLAVPLGLLLVGLVFAAVNMRTPLVMLGSVAQVLQAQLSLSASDIGYLGALPMPLFALGSLMAALLAKWAGLTRMMVLMTLLLTVAVALRVWIGVGVLYVGTLTLSFAIGMLNALTAPFIKAYAPSHIATATGVFSLSMSVMAGLSAFLVLPMAELMGWQLAMSSWALFGIMAAAIWLWMYRQEIKHLKYPQQDKPAAVDASDEMPSQAVPFRPWRILAAWQMAVLLGVQSLLFYAVASFLPSIGMGLGADTVRANAMALSFQLMAPPAIILLTYLVRRGVQTRLLALIACACNVVGVAMLIWMPAWLVSASLLMGFGCALIFTLSLMMFSLRTSHSDNARDLSSMVQAVGYSIAFFGPLSVGALYEYSGGWTLPLYVLLALMLINVPFGYWAASAQKLDG